MKGLYDISVLFKIFKRFEKVVLAWKFGEKWAKIGKNGCPRIPIYTLLTVIVKAMDSRARGMNTIAETTINSQ